MSITNAVSPKIALAALAVALAAPALAEPQLHYWPAQDTKDAMGGPDAVLGNGAAIVQGQFHFNDGAAGVTRAFVDLGPAADFGASDFLLSFQMKTVQPGLAAMLAKRSICDHSSFWSIRLQDGGLAVEVDDGAGNYTVFFSKAKTLANGKWHAISLARTGFVTSLYVDGELDSSAVAPYAVPASVTNAANLVAGSDVCINADTTVPFVGALDEIVVSSK